MEKVIMCSPEKLNPRDFQLTKLGEKFYIPQKITMPVRVSEVDCFSGAIASYEEAFVKEEVSGNCLAADCHGLIEVNEGNLIYIRRYYKNGDLAILAYWIESIDSDGIAHSGKI